MGVAIFAITGAFGYVFSLINDAKAELKEDQVEEIQSLRSEINRMELMFKDKFREGAEDRSEMWRSIQAMERRGTEQHAANLERLAQIPTRDEMLRMLQQFTAVRPTQH